MGRGGGGGGGSITVELKLAARFSAANGRTLSSQQTSPCLSGSAVYWASHDVLMRLAAAGLQQTKLNFGVP